MSETINLLSVWELVDISEVENGNEVNGIIIFIPFTYFLYI